MQKPAPRIPEFQKLFGESIVLQVVSEEKIGKTKKKTTNVLVNRQLFATIASEFVPRFPDAEEEDDDLNEDETDIQNVTFHLHNLQIVHDRFAKKLIINGQLVFKFLPRVDNRSPSAKYVSKLRQIADQLLVAAYPSALQLPFDTLLKYFFEMLKLAATYEALFDFKAFFEKNKESLGLFSQLQHRKEVANHSSSHRDIKKNIVLSLGEQPLLRLRYLSNGPTFSSLGMKTVTLIFTSLMEGTEEAGTAPQMIVSELLNEYACSSATLSLMFGQLPQNIGSIQLSRGSKQLVCSFSDVFSDITRQENRTSYSLDERTLQSWSTNTKFMTDFMNAIKLPAEYRNKHFWKFLLSHFGLGGCEVPGFSSIFERFTGEAAAMERNVIMMFYDSLHGLLKMKLWGLMNSCAMSDISIQW